MRRPYSKIGGIPEEWALVRSVPFEILYALAELVVGKMDESPCFAKLLLNGLMADMLSLNMGRQAFG